MEISGGKSRLVGWMVVAAAAAGIWVLLPLVESATTCPDPTGVDIPCPMNEVENLTCTYVKGIPADLPKLPPGIINFPGEAIGLTATPFLRYENSTACRLYLNITWKINLRACQYLQGFILDVTFFYDGQQRYVNRTYSLSVGNWSNLDVYRTAFRHECIVPADTPTSYQIKVHSLPMSTLAEFPNYASITHTQTPAAKTMASCDNPSNPDMTNDWRATMWISQNSSEDNRNNLEICFFFAPVVFGFNQYRLSLMNITTSSSGQTIEQVNIYDNGTQQDRKECFKWGKVCPGIYKVHLMPVATILLYGSNGTCTCRVGPGPNDCRDICAATVLEPIDMSNSSCVTTTTAATTTTTAAAAVPPSYDIIPVTSPPVGTTTEASSTSSLPPYAASAFNSGKIGGVVAGVILAIILVTAIVLFLHSRRRRKSEKLPVLGPASQDDEMQISTLPKRHRVLLVYSTDNESHRKVIRSFAAFLHACCGCDVLYDEWSQMDIAQTNPIDWLSKQMYGVKQVVVVNSLGAYEQHRGWIEQKLYVPDTNLLLPDVFIPAIRQVQSKVFSGCPQFRCFHVCFPYTDQKHVLDLSGGKCYKLMDHIEDLFLHIHGLTKFSAKGTTSAGQINAASYYLTAKEGIALRKAIDDATDFARENPNWFQSHYRRDDDDATATTAGEDDIRIGNNNRTVGAEPSTVNSTGIAGGSDSSSIGTASDMEYFAPSLPDSYSGDDLGGGGAGGGVMSVSPDAGIGGMGHAVSSSYSSTSSVPSPAEFLLFSPPEGLDDDASSVGSRSVVAKINELNDQYDSGLSSSMQQDLSEINVHRT